MLSNSPDNNRQYISLTASIPNNTAQAVEISPWNPYVDKPNREISCIGGCQRRLILYRYCLTVDAMLQKRVQSEKADVHRNDCDERLVPLIWVALLVVRD